jgi:hypothetical protein
MPQIGEHQYVPPTALAQPLFGGFVAIGELPAAVFRPIFNTIAMALRLTNHARPRVFRFRPAFAAGGVQFARSPTIAADRPSVGNARVLP